MAENLAKRNWRIKKKIFQFCCCRVKDFSVISDIVVVENGFHICFIFHTCCLCASPPKQFPNASLSNYVIVYRFFALQNHSQKCFCSVRHNHIIYIFYPLFVGSENTVCQSKRFQHSCVPFVVSSGLGRFFYRRFGVINRQPKWNIKMPSILLCVVCMLLARSLLFFVVGMNVEKLLDRYTLETQIHSHKNSIETFAPFFSLSSVRFVVLCAYAQVYMYIVAVPFRNERTRCDI